MTDNRGNKGPNRDFIKLEHEHEAKYWARSLGVTVYELRAAVRAVGNSAVKVRDHLNVIERLMSASPKDKAWTRYYEVRRKKPTVKKASQQQRPKLGFAGE